MDCNSVKIGLRVKIGPLGNIDGLLVHEKHLAVRKEGTGTVKQYVPGHGGDVWFVQHDDSEDVGAYIVSEMAPESDPEPLNAIQQAAIAAMLKPGTRYQVIKAEVTLREPYIAGSNRGCEGGTVPSNETAGPDLSAAEVMGLQERFDLTQKPAER